MSTLKETHPEPGKVYKIENPTFGVATVVAVKVPHPERAFRMQFAPLNHEGIAYETLYWDSVCDDQVLETFPSIRAYLRSLDGPELESWIADARGSKPVPTSESSTAEPAPAPTPAAPPAVAVTELPPTRPLPAGCKCDPKNWPPLPAKIPAPCQSYTEDLTEAGKCVMCEHLQECHQQ